MDVRSCGTDKNAVAPITNELIWPADLIICMERKHAAIVREYTAAERFNDFDANENQALVSLGIPDEFSRFQPELVDLLVNAIKHHDEEVSAAIARGAEALYKNHPELKVQKIMGYASSMFGAGS